MLCIYDKSIETRFPDYIHIQGHNYSSKKNHKFAIASFSWAIAFNINNSYNSQSHYLRGRGDEYHENNFFKEASEDYNRALIFDSLPGKTTGSFQIYTDILRAINYGGSQKSIFYANRGMELAAESDWLGVFQHFNTAIDADLFFAASYTKAGKKIYREAVAEIKKALCFDLELHLNKCTKDRDYTFPTKQKLLEISDLDDFSGIVRHLIKGSRYSAGKNFKKIEK